MSEWKQVRHLDGDQTHNEVSNLAWGSVSDNTLDQVRHGTHVNARRTACPEGHPLSGMNVRVTRDGGRICQSCDAARKRRARATEEEPR